MANFSTWLLVIFMVMFWMFRAVVALCTQYSTDLLGFVAYNLNVEIILAFVTILCIVLVIKRKLIGAILYFGIYGVYYGQHFVTNLIPLIEKTTTLTVDISMNMFSDFLAILLSIFVILDMLIDKSRKVNPIDKKTDWYFKNQKYDDELKARDQREDNNEYKFY